MAAGFLMRGVCYSTVTEANDAYWTYFAPQMVSGPTSYLTEVMYLAGAGWRMVGWSVSSTGVWTQRFNSAVLSPNGWPTCETTGGFYDGLALGWAVVGVMVIAWGARKIREQMR